MRSRLVLNLLFDFYLVFASCNLGFISLLLSQGAGSGIKIFFECCHKILF